jgi:hypothetical protein
VGNLSSCIILLLMQTRAQGTQKHTSGIRSVLSKVATRLSGSHNADGRMSEGGNREEKGDKETRKKPSDVYVLGHQVVYFPSDNQG